MANAIGRPAPPGRPRASQSRSASTYSNSRQTPPRSPLREEVQLPTDNHSDNQISQGKMSHSSTVGSSLGLGLNATDLNSMTDISSTGTHEISFEEFDDYLRDTNREDLVLALKRAKEQMDELDAKLDVHVDRSEQLQSALEEYSTQVATLENDKTSLEFALTHREERIDDLMREQERMEHDVYLKDEINERLRKQLDESERAKLEAERRYNDQTNTIDKERQYYLDTEKLLQTQKANATATLDKVQSNNQQLMRENERLQSQLARLQKGNPRAAELLEDGSVDGCDSSVANRSKSLLNEQDARELDTLRDELAKLQANSTSSTEIIQQLQVELRDLKAKNAELRSQNETFVDLLQEKTMSGELITGSAMLNRQYETMHSSEASSSTELSTAEASELEDDVPDVPTKKDRKSDSHKRRLMAQASREVMNAPRNLASELEQSETNEEEREARRRERTRERSEALSDNVETLHKEILDLRDANQALTLYVTKILDRIIAKEGYEQVLAIDADQKRTLRSKASRLHSRAAIPEAISPEKTAKQTNGGGGFLGLGRPQEPTSPESPDTPTAKSVSFQARARRTASIDWRSLWPSVGASLTSPVTPETETNATNDARRIRSSEEVEDNNDELERERIRENLRQQGIVAPDHQLKPQKRQSTSIGTFFQRVIGGGAATSPTEQKTDMTSVSKGEQHPAPRVTTFDSANLSVSQSEADSSFASEDSNASSHAARMSMRQRALDQGSSGNLTEAPARRSIIEERKARRSGNMSGGSLSPTISRTSASGISGADSASTSPVLGTANIDEENPGWRKALRRMSLLGSSNTSVPSINDGDKS